jgi:hypothetical protein
MDLAPGLINSTVIRSGSSNSSAVSGSKYFYRSCRTDLLTVENYMWKSSGPSRITSLAVDVVAEAIGNSGVVATIAQYSRKEVLLFRVDKLYLNGSKCDPGL